MFWRTIDLLCCLWLMLQFLCNSKVVTRGWLARNPWTVASLHDSWFWVGIRIGAHFYVLFASTEDLYAQKRLFLVYWLELHNRDKVFGKWLFYQLSVLLDVGGRTGIGKTPVWDFHEFTGRFDIFFSFSKANEEKMVIQQLERKKNQVIGLWFILIFKKCLYLLDLFQVWFYCPRWIYLKHTYILFIFSVDF